MIWILITLLTWLAVSPAVGVMVGKAVSLAEDRRVH